MAVTLGRVVNIIIVIILSTILFGILQPGNIITVPGNNKIIDFMSRKTNLKAIIVHPLIYLFTIAGFLTVKQLILDPILLHYIGY